MALNPKQFADSVNALFDPTVNWHDPARLAESSAAFHNLSLHYVQKHVPQLFDFVDFDQLKEGLMLKRFYRDAFGVGRFHDFLDENVTDEPLRLRIKGEAKYLSIRINSTSPKKTRIAAAFSLWMATMRPIFILQIPENFGGKLWKLEAIINFWIATSYLSKFGEIQIGIPDDLNDFEQRLRRIRYDFTFRDLNLSSLEMMYASIFRPRRGNG